MMENMSAEATSPDLPHVEIELVQRMDQDGQSNNEELVKVDIGTESIVETMSFESMTTPLCWALSLEIAIFIVQNKETEGLWHYSIATALTYILYPGRDIECTIFYMLTVNQHRALHVKTVFYIQM